MYEIRDYDFDKQRRVLRKKGFVWCAYFLAYKNKSEVLYKQIEDAWTDLDTCTDESIAFLISMESESLYEKFIKKIKHTEYLPIDRKHTIAETNTLILSKAKKIFNIREEQVPCLLFFNLLETSNVPIVVPLAEDSKIFEIMQYIMIKTRVYQEQLNRRVNEIKRMGLRRIENYLYMKKILLDISRDNGLDIEFIECTLRELPNSYAEKRLIDYWEMNKEIIRKGKGGNYYDSKLIEKIIDVRIKIGPNFRAKKRKYDEIYKSIEYINNCIRNIVENIDTSRCKEDVICYTKEYIKELEQEISEKTKAEYIECVCEAKEIIDKLSKEKLVIDEIRRWIDYYRNLEVTRLVDDVSRLVFIRDVFLFLIHLFE